jgi:antitoxin YefM
MTKETTLAAARREFSRLCDDVASSGEAVIIRRRGAKDVALVPAEEFGGWIETAHLLRSPENSRRLVDAMMRAQTAKRVVDVERGRSSKRPRRVRPNDEAS